MNSTFCDNCDNFMFTYVDTKTNKLYNGCKVCGYKDDVETNDNDYIYVTIIDNGVGFEHVDKTKMLTPYYTTKKNGTGLGLAVVTKIISDHNSSIYFNTIDEGAKIKITIPKYYDK